LARCLFLLVLVGPDLLLLLHRDHVTAIPAITAAIPAITAALR
jgi:hypothetical protein